MSFHRYDDGAAMANEGMNSGDFNLDQQVIILAFHVDESSMSFWGRGGERDIAAINREGRRKGRRQEEENCKGVRGGGILR